VNVEPQIPDRSTTDVEFQLKRWLPILAGVVLAVYAGYWVGNNNWSPLWRLMWVTVVVFVAFSLQEYGWILIPLFWTATGTIEALPLPFAWRDLGILLATAAYLAHRSMVKTPSISLRHVLFVLLAANLAWVVMAWLRKPIGFRVFQSETLGARTYFNIFMTAVAVWVLLRLPQTAHKLSRIPYYLLNGTLIGAAGSLLIFLLPFTAGLVRSVYGEAEVSSGMPVEIYRFGAFRNFGMILILLVVSRCHPTKLFHPARPYFYLLLLGLACVAISGFRSTIAICFAYIGLSMILRRNWRQFALASTAAILLLGALIGGQGRLYSLPLPVQRALCFLPGDWSPVVVRDAVGSTEGRFTWWKDIIKYNLIGNWWFGDGIGIRAAEMISVDEGSRFNYFESVLFYGAYHNGPLGVIRSIGIVGLLLLYALMFCGCIHANRCLRRCQGTPLEFLAMFIAIPILWYPIHFTLVFGGFESDMPQVIFQTGLLLLLIRMMNEHPELLATENTPA
jgi:hypothetical protein